MLRWAMVLLLMVGPLTDEQRARLETAREGRDHREEAFFALIEHFAAWDGSPPTEPVRLHIDSAAMIAEPEVYRGDLCLIVGRLEQRSALKPPYDVAEEWFIRDASGTAVIVYVAGLSGDEVFREGRRVRVLARFYKRVDAVARDGVERSYAAFVGAHPQRVEAAPAGAAQLLIVLVPVMVLLIAFVVLMMYVRRQRGGRRGVRRAIGPEDAAVLDEIGPLPDDPAEALAELRRRADAER